MSWFILAIRKSLDYRGRSRRREYWWYSVVVWSMLIPAFVCDAAWGLSTLEQPLGPTVIGLLLLSVIPGLPLHVRRLHDIGRTGWWVLIGLTGIGSIVLTVIGLFDSNPQDNQYGMSPKYARDGSRLDERPANARSPLKNAFTGVVFVGILFAVVALSGRHFFANNIEGEMSAFEQRQRSGERAGYTSSELDCFKASMQRTVQLPEKTIQAIVMESVGMSSCLKNSAYDPGFCEGVPAETDVMSSALFIASACESMGLGGAQYCISIVQSAARYCNSPERAAKVNAGRSS